jgi:sugar lactone lactonase YvrE
MTPTRVRRRWFSTCTLGSNTPSRRKAAAIWLAAASAVGLVACGDDKGSDPGAFPAQITLNERAFYPEGIAYSQKQDQIFVGSFFKGKVATLDTDGALTTFVEDDSLVSVVGLAVDEANGWLVVTNSDIGRAERSQQATAFQLAQLLIYELDTGDHVRTVDLAQVYAGAQFVNDVITDGNGTIYATNSASPVIYKVDSAGNPSVLVEDDALGPPQPDAFGMNGIEYHDDGFLLVSHGADLYKVPLDSPSNFSKIVVSGALNAIDGLLLTDRETLVVVSNNLAGLPYEEAIYQLRSDDGWASATIQSTFSELEDKMPTTAALVGTDVYVTHANFATLDAYLRGGGTSPLSEAFVVQKVAF